MVLLESGDFPALASDCLDRLLQACMDKFASHSYDSRHD